MLRKDARFSGIVSAEMKECKWTPVHCIFLAVSFELPRVNVPIGNVVRFVFENGYWKHPRDQIDPSLIGHHPVLVVHHAAVPQAVLPPLKKFAGCAGITQGDETEII